MKRTACMAAAFLCSAAFAVAQSPTTTTASSSTTADKDKITVSGCLQGAASSSTTASTSTASSSMGSYELITTPMASDTTAGTTGSTSTTTSSTDAKSNMRARGTTRYLLDGHDSELKNHVGHRVEITGTLGTSNEHGSAATSTTTSGSASNRMDHPTETLKVSSVRMISANCSAR